MESVKVVKWIHTQILNSEVLRSNVLQLTSSFVWPHFQAHLDVYAVLHTNHLRANIICESCLSMIVS